ncbi:hypothetical protein QWZ03_09270 [Chitinimonas viridis]|uniref:Phage tail tape measure protein n=2 Tax=Chitinimonas TaxID=240411 RepID=A0ABT8B545_9NEIS|nr:MULTISPECIES: hypothetical protein [Chitinimonas]MBL8509050.1 hypothetical protein [Chitinimonas sp.]MDN3576955.1 hypothetical protein [Chitinimonas viridis]GLR13722.1 hypothetical protein GCM10007907_25120 [Chitinimonas prasina]
MAGLSEVRGMSANLSQTLQESTRLVMNDVQQQVDRLDRKKMAVAQQGVERLQEKNQIAAQISQHRGKIDTYA